MMRALSRLGLAVAALLLAEGTAHACSCVLGAVNEATKRHYVRSIVIDAAVIGRFEVVEHADHGRGIGELVRPLETYVGQPRPSYRLEYAENPCSSSFDADRIAVLYRPGRHADDMSEHLELERLADRLGKAAGSRTRLAAVRREIARRRPDAAAARYVDGGICPQLFLRDVGTHTIRQEAARAGRKTR